MDRILVEVSELLNVPNFFPVYSMCTFAQCCKFTNSTSFQASLLDMPHNLLIEYIIHCLFVQLKFVHCLIPVVKDNNYCKQACSGRFLMPSICLYILISNDKLLQTIMDIVFIWFKTKSILGFTATTYVGY